MKFYVLRSVLNDDTALIDLSSHWDYSFISGQEFDSKFLEKGPVLFNLDLDSPGRSMPTLFTSPAFVTRKVFVDDLRHLGIKNLQVYSTHIRNPESGEVNSDHQLVNIIGRISCAHIKQSEVMNLGDEINVIDKLVLDAARLPALPIFRLAEDPVQVIVNQPVAEYLQNRYTDLYLEIADVV